MEAHATEKQRGLSYLAARSCEEACEDKCECRCGGALHGAKRIGADRPLGFAELPADDPHHVPVERHPPEVLHPAGSDCPRCEKPFARRQQAQPSREVPGALICQPCAREERQRKDTRVVGTKDRARYAWMVKRGDFNPNGRD